MRMLCSVWEKKEVMSSLSFSCTVMSMSKQKPIWWRGQSPSSAVNMWNKWMWNIFHSSFTQQWNERMKNGEDANAFLQVYNNNDFNDANGYVHCAFNKNVDFFSSLDQMTDWLTGCCWWLCGDDDVHRSSNQNQK